MQLSFEKSVSGSHSQLITSHPIKDYALPDELQRKTPPRLPEMSQPEISRHYTELAKAAHGVNDGFYPLGSCTMKYNPKINDELASLPQFATIHPLQPLSTVQGALELLSLTEERLTEITGMDHMTFQPAAGAHGELTALLMFKAYHESKGQGHRTKMLIPEAAHGTNPASAAMVGYETINIPSNPQGSVDMTAFKELLSEDIAGLMLTNPNTVGIFEEHILEITELVHQSGGLTYYDGANLNPIMGVVRPGDMGFDVVHLNLHKTFSTPHGGGGPGSGPIGCKGFLKDFLPTDYPILTDNGYDMMRPEQSIGRMKAFYGHFLTVLRAFTYISILGNEGIREAANQAVLNANYLRHHLKDCYEIAYPGYCMHEFVITLEKLKKNHDVTALDMAKAMLDYGIHPPTMYFPNVVPEALMVEPTETESKQTLDEVIRIYHEIYEIACQTPEKVKEAPHETLVKRLDEVTAARQPILRYDWS